MSVTPTVSPSTNRSEQLWTFLARPAAGGNGGTPQHFSYNAILLARGELREHRKRQHLRSSFLRDRKITGTETKSFVGLRGVKPDRIVNTCTNAGLVQTFLELRPIAHPQHIGVVDRTRPLRLIGKCHASLRTGKQCGKLSHHSCLSPD